MKKLIISVLFFTFALMKAEVPNPVSTEISFETNTDEKYEKLLEILGIVKIETTKREWQLFCDVTSYPFSMQHSFLQDNEKVALSWEEALLCAKWLIDNEQESGFLTQILKEIDECPAPTPGSVAELCSALMTPEQDTSEMSIGYNYQNILWKLACAKPKIDSTQVGREKVRNYWNKYKKDIRCPGQGLSDTDNISVAKHAIDTSSVRFTRELAIAYKVDFNFVDEKDGMTVLDFVQKRIDQANRLVPKPEQTLIEYQAVYDAIVRVGGKHKKDLTPEELAR